MAIIIFKKKKKERGTVGKAHKRVRELELAISFKAGKS